MSAILTGVFLVVGQPMFADTAGTADFSVGYLGLFAFLRSFLLLSLLVVLTCFGMRFWKYAKGIDRQISAASYNMYLGHLFFIIGLQVALLEWAGGPVAIKIGIVFLGTLWGSFAISRGFLASPSRAFAVEIMVLFVFCLVVRP